MGPPRSAFAVTAVDSLKLSAPGDSLRRRWGLWSQVLLLFLAWLILGSLHWDTDGLWYQGDSPRHALNGLFWRDFLANGCREPYKFASEYYARYPAICPTLYPPVFYFFEAGAFALLGPSAEVAKGLVLVFAFATGLYTLILLRRWIHPSAGALAGLVLLLPGVVKSSHAVMLNVPALAFGVGALYHTRRAFELSGEGRSSRQLAIGVALALLAILTHPTMGVVVFIGTAWMIALGSWRILLKPKTLYMAGAGAIVMLPVFYLLRRWGPQQFAQLLPPIQYSFSLYHGLRYTFENLILPLTGKWLLILASAGLVVGLVRRRWRREILVIALWLAVPVVVLSCIWAKDTRYLLIASPGVVCLLAILAVEVRDLLAYLGSERVGQVGFGLFIGGCVFVAVQENLQYPLKSVRPMFDVVAFSEQVAPSEPVLYHGKMDGTFIFDLRIRDPHYQRQVVLLRKLLDADLKQNPNAEQIRQRIVASGCRWLILEKLTPAAENPLAKTLREVVASSDFDRVREFPMHFRGDLEQINVYRIINATNIPQGNPPVFELPQEVNGRKVQPIHR